MPKGIYKRKNSGNKIMVNGETSIVYTNKNQVILIDTEDISKINNYTWWIDVKGYAVTHVKVSNGKRRPLFMHRLIINAPNGFDVDHINHIPTDNRKINVRICTHQQNCFNSKIRTHNSSGVIGVNWHKHKQQWQVRIMVNKRSISLGYYDDLEKAKKIRRNAELKHFGEFALTS